MFAFVVQRLFQAIIVMLAVALVAFSLFQFVGDPINNMVGQDATEEQREALRERLGLNDPVPIQFAKFALNTAQGNFGVSYRIGQSVDIILADRLPATLELVFVAAILALLFGVPMGVYSGLHRDSFLSRLFQTISLVGISLPTFLIGIILILIFGVWLQALPTFGRSGTVDIGAWETGLLTVDGWRSLILPATTLALFQLTLIMRLIRAEMLEVLRTDYIKFARARGLRNRAINYGHALKNTLVPVITIMGLQIGFQWPGMGLLIIQAIQFVDIPVMSTYLVLIAFFFVMINLLVDMLYFVVDPRLRGERGLGH